MRKNLLFLLAVVLVSSLQISAQPYCDVRSYSLNEGLAANVISSIGQTPDQLMWFGTWNGLCNFDDYRFTTYRDKPGKDGMLPTNRVLKICPNTKNNVWVLSYDRQLYLFDTHLCQYVDIEKLLDKPLGSDPKLGSIYSLGNGYTWVVGDNTSVSLRISDDLSSLPSSSSDSKQSKHGIMVFRGFHLLNALLDAQGREWLLTDKGVRNVDGKIRTSLMGTLMVNFRGRTFFIAKSGQMVSIGKGERNFRRESPALANNLTVNDACSWRGTIVLATTKGLYQYAKGRMTHFPAPFMLMDGSDNVKKLFVDNRQRLWSFTTGDGVLLNDGKTTQRLQALPSSQLELTTSTNPFIHQDEHGTVWVVPNNGTFSYYDESRRQLVPYPLYSGKSLVACIPLIKKYYVDSQHNLWFTGNRGLTMLNFCTRQVNQISTIPNHETRALYADREGNFWVGDEFGCLAIYDKAFHVKGYVTPSGSLQPTPTSFTTRVYSLYEDRKGRMWIGTKESGLYCINKGSVSHYVYDGQNPYSLSQNDVYDIGEDTKGRIWVATYGGGINLLEEQKSGARFINPLNVMKQFPIKKFGKVRRITKTPQGVILLSTTAGLVTFSDKFKNAKDIRFYTTTHQKADTASLSSADVMQTLVTRNGRIYVNTMGGSFQMIESKNLLSNNLKLSSISAVTASEGLVQSMIEDREGNIWLVRETTLDKYQPRNNQLSTYISSSFSYDMQFSEAKPAVSKASDLYLIGGDGGLIAFNPKKLKKSIFKPNIVFTRLQFQGNEESVSILNKPEIEVPSNKRSVTIFFSSLDYSDNSLIRYAYMLKGIDDRWNYVGTAHSASFNHLPHGHLTLLVRSTNADGVWQDNTRELHIYVHPTFWESWMGWLLYIIIGGGLVFLALYLYAQQQRIKMQNKLRDMMTEFFTNIGHKLRTPLTLIGGPVKQVMNNEKLSDRGQELLSMVERNSESMLKLVNDMLDYDHNPDNYLVDDSTAPVAATVSGLAATESTGPTNAEKPAPSQPDVKLLVVEDNPDLRRYLFTILSNEYSVLTAENGQVGLETARKEQPDFIISDVMMPEMDGLTMVHQLKQDKNTSHIPIIILSAKASLHDRLQGLQEGIDDYITKPFSAIYLKERVANIINRRRILQQEMMDQLSAQLAQSGDKDAMDAAPSATSGPEKSDMAATVPDSATTPTTSSTSTVKEEMRGDVPESSATQDNAVSDTSAPASDSNPDKWHLSAPEIIDEDKVMMEKLMAYLDKHISDSDFKVGDMADAVGLGRTVFYGKIKSIVGMSPIDLVRHLRLQRAKYLVVNSKMGFSQIAYDVGFSDPKYFSKCFKKETGMSPSEYRAKNKSDD